VCHKLVTRPRFAVVTRVTRVTRFEQVVVVLLSSPFVLSFSMK
jgi:hypothetical protein